MTPPLRIGLLGASRIAPRAILAPARETPGAVVTAVGARDAAKAGAYAAEHAIPAAVDYAGLVTHPQVDLVYVALPPSEHRAWVLAALAAGKAVLVEKPFAMTGEEAQAMTQAAAAAGRPLMEAFHYRFHAAFAAAQAVIAQGRLGEIVRAETVFDAPIPDHAGELRWTRALGGGALMDLGCYGLHALRTLLRHEPQVVSAQCDLRHGVDAATRAELRFGDTPATLACSMSAAIRHDHLTIVGAKATLHFERFVSPQNGGRLSVVTPDGASESLPVEGPASYAAQLAHVMQVMAGEAEPLTGGADAVAQAQAIDAIYRLGRS